jgi:hypothetical protein
MPFSCISNTSVRSRALSENESFVTVDKGRGISKFSVCLVIEFPSLELDHNIVMVKDSTPQQIELPSRYTDCCYILIDDSEAILNEAPMYNGL